MKVTNTNLKNVKVIELDVYNDGRGYFFESYNSSKYIEHGIPSSFSQSNISYSGQNVLRGLHYQLGNPQGKLVQCLKGMVYDVVVDLNEKSNTFMSYFGIILSEKNHKQLWVPPGYAHGFLAMDTENIFNYSCTHYYDKKEERTLLWNDPTINIKWPTVGDFILSEKDEEGKNFQELYDTKQLYDEQSVHNNIFMRNYEH